MLERQQQVPRVAPAVVHLQLQLVQAAGLVQHLHEQVPVTDHGPLDQEDVGVGVLGEILADAQHARRVDKGLELVRLCLGIRVERLQRAQLQTTGQQAPSRRRP